MYALRHALSLPLSHTHTHANISCSHPDKSFCMKCCKQTTECTHYQIFQNSIQNRNTRMITLQVIIYASHCIYYASFHPRLIVTSHDMHTGEKWSQSTQIFAGSHPARDFAHWATLEIKLAMWSPYDLHPVVQKAEIELATTSNNCAVTVWQLVGKQSGLNNRDSCMKKWSFSYAFVELNINLRPVYRAAHIMTVHYWIHKFSY
jgi:hypothetical protein